MDEELGELEAVDLREYWADEAHDFTPWLSQEENLGLLGDALHLDLELDDTEVRIGNYSADIVARDINSEDVVLIENQLSSTDHDHLGKTLTYAAGLGASVVVWICRELREEHRQALDWLNEKTDQDVGFFALELELWRIGNSKPAPQFNVVSEPNEWAEIAKESSKQAQLSGVKKLQREFWAGLRDHIEERPSRVRPRKPQPQHWYSMAVGRSRFKISLTANTREDRLGCELYISHDQADRAFELLKKQKDEIEDKIGETLDWQPLPDAQACRIAVFRDGDIRDKDSWPEYFAWFHEKADAFYEAFSDRVQDLTLDPSPTDGGSGAVEVEP